MIKDEFLLAATAQNLRKMAKLLPAGAPAMAGRDYPAPIALGTCERPLLS